MFPFKKPLYKYFVIVHLRDGSQLPPQQLPDTIRTDDEAKETLHQINQQGRLEMNVQRLELVKQQRYPTSEGGIILPH